MDREAWRAVVHGIAKSRTQLKRLSTHACSRGSHALPPSQSSSPFPAQTLRRWSAALKQNCQPLGFSSRLAVTCPYLSPPVPASPGPGPHACLSQLLKSVLASDPESLLPWERLSSLSSLVLHELVPGTSPLLGAPLPCPPPSFSPHLGLLDSSLLTPRRVSCLAASTAPALENKQTRSQKGLGCS